MTRLRKHMIRVGYAALCIITSLSLWHHLHIPKPRTEVITVTAKPVHKILNFTGVIQPLHETNLISPVAAVVESSYCHYGQKVIKGQIIYTLNSPELQREFHDILTEYLKAKDSYDISLHKFSGTEELWKAGLLSRNNYLTERSGLNTVRVSLMQATRKLSDILEKLDKSEYDELSRLSFAEFDKVRLALASKHNLIQIKAARSGILLTPPKGNANESDHLGIGSAVKAGQVLGLIGDMHGIRLEINIPEIDIANIKVGTPAIIRGLAFQQLVMHGSVVAINAQASTGSGTSLPYFTAVVEVHDLNEELQGSIKVGMSATIQLILQQTDKILIPIDAIEQTAKHAYVTVLDKQHVPHQTLIKTGAIHGDKVIIESGLKVGDTIRYEPH